MFEKCNSRMHSKHTSKTKQKMKRNILVENDQFQNKSLYLEALKILPTSLIPKIICYPY